MQTTGKRIIPTKNIKHISKPILKDRGHTPSFKDLREITGICAAVKKLQKNKDPNLFNEIDRRINIMAGKYPLLTLKDFSNTTNIVEIPWSEWKNNLQESLKAIKEVNYREEAAIR